MLYLDSYKNAPAHRMNGEQGLTNEPNMRYEMAGSNVRKNTIRTCKVEGCGRTDIIIRRMCSGHYQYYMSHGGELLYKPTPIERFLEKVCKTPHCWVWMASKNVGGYGKFSVDGKPRLAYRWYYQYLNGPIQKGLEIDHLCRNPACVNPNHLEPVTRKENQRRGLKGILKTHCANGHEYVTENIYIDRKGWRRCRICAYEGIKRRRKEAKGNLA